MSKQQAERVIAVYQASIPEPGALTFTLDETRQICAALMPPPSYHVMQRIINAVLALRGAKSSRPAPVPEPAPEQDDVTVDVSKEQRVEAAHVLIALCKEGPFRDYGEAIRKLSRVFARRGKVTLEAVEKAVMRAYVAGVDIDGSAVFWELCARLSAPKPPSKQERVTVDAAKVYLDGKWIASFPSGEINGTQPGLGRGRAERYAAGLRLELEASHAD